MSVAGRRILLLVDNCSAHIVASTMGNVKLMFLPPNCTAAVQPLDQGVIRAFKAQYRGRLLRQIILQLDETTGYRSPSVLDALFMVVDAWDAVRQSTIVGCWRNAGFGLHSANADTVESAEPDLPLAEMWRVVTEGGIISGYAGFDYFVGIDDGLDVCPILTDEVILESITNVVTEQG